MVNCKINSLYFDENHDVTLPHDTEIVLVNDFGSMEGGASAVAIETALTLKNLGVNVCFFCGSGPICEDLKDEEIEIGCLNEQSIGEKASKIEAIIKGIWNKRALKEFSRFLSNKNPSNTIVHIHSWTKVLSSSIFYVAYKMGFSVLLTVHDYFSVCPNGGFYNYQKKVICKKKPMSPSCVISNCDRDSYVYKIWRILRQIVQDKNVRYSRRLNIAFVSDFQKEILTPYLSAQDKCSVLPNPIGPISDPACKAVELAFLFIGRLSPEKGPDLFCEAVSSLNERGIVIGDGKMREALEQAYVDKHIEFCGWINPADMGARIPPNSVLVFPSRLYECAPITPIQCLEKGIPCVVPYECAASEYILEGHNGYCFHTGSISSLILALKKVTKLVGKVNYDSYEDDSAMLLLDKYRQILASRRETD